MRAPIKLFVGFILALFLQNCFAIQVSVHATSKVSALGFTVNGKNYGGTGSSYSKKDAPAGTYTFGVRVNGVFGTDVGCPLANGTDTVRITSDSTAVLAYNGKQCVLKVYPMRH